MCNKSCLWFPRESDGLFAYGNYMKEVEDLRAVVEHFNSANHIVSAIVGHSKGLLLVLRLIVFVRNLSSLNVSCEC